MQFESIDVTSAIASTQTFDDALPTYDVTSRLYALRTFLKSGEIDKFEVGVRSKFQQSEHEAVCQADFLIAVERYREIVVIQSVFQRHHVVHTEDPQWPRRHNPLDRLWLTQQDGFTQQTRVDVGRKDAGFSLG